MDVVEPEFSVSDHSAAVSKIPINFEISPVEGFGRAFWATDNTWNAALQVLDPLFEDLAVVVDSLANNTTPLSLTLQNLQARR